ncbi:MAG: hypothetical protein ABIE36_00895 [Candidatus Diapherotrites archaeon]
MIIYKKYTQKETSGRTETILEGKLRFEKEILPIIRENIESRMYNNPEEEKCKFYDYLRKVEKISYSEMYKIYRDHTLKGRKFSITERPRKLGIDIKVSSSQNLESNEILNLDALNNFILTGEYPKG